ncbi:MAG: hypothetical protein ACUVR0_08035 [Candidatus Aminicenantales bacterium]
MAEAFQAAITQKNDFRGDFKAVNFTRQGEWKVGSKFKVDGEESGVSFRLLN